MRFGRCTNDCPTRACHRQQLLHVLFAHTGKLSHRKIQFITHVMLIVVVVGTLFKKFIAIGTVSSSLSFIFVRLIALESELCLLVSLSVDKFYLYALKYSLFIYSFPYVFLFGLVK